MYTLKELVIRSLHKDEVDDAYLLEKEGYPEDESASQEILTYRHTEAPELNRGCFDGEQLVGFISATRYHEPTLKEEAMHMHIPNGESICIHSVCVKPSHQRRGIATHMLKEFVNYVSNEEKGALRILLICKSKLIPLYTRAGFVFKCKSEVIHGFPEDEADSLDVLEYRQIQAPDLNRGCFRGDELIGFISGSRYHGQTLTDESMEIHVPNGESVCIFTVCVKTPFRRQGIATHMLKEFIGYVSNELKDTVRVLLICKAYLIPFYTRLGFFLKGKSEVEQSGEPWYELEMNLQQQ